MHHNNKTLTGIWHGLYSYPAFEQPVFFVATLISFAQLVSGATHEAQVGQEGAPLTVFAAVDGQVAGTDVSFQKRYDGTGGWSHVVHYEGTLSADGHEIEGEWTIPGDWSGRFMMIRGEGASEKAIRKVFAIV